MSKNTVFDKLCRFVFDKRYRFAVLDRYHLYDWMQDEEYLKRRFYSNMGYELNLKNPCTFNE